MAKRGSLTALAYLFGVVVVLFVAKAHSRPHSLQEGNQFCAKKSGLTFYDIVESKGRNDGCAVDCATKQGTLYTYYRPEGTKCHDSDQYECVLGKCFNKDLDPIDRTGLNKVTIQIIRAYVPDLDKYPGGGESDTYIVVQAEGKTGPSYKDGDFICHTYVVQDNKNPCWKDFVCHTLPLHNDTVLKFQAVDSDKPLTDPELIGEARENLSHLMNKGPTRLDLYKTVNDQNGYFVEVDVKSSPYNVIEED